MRELTITGTRGSLYCDVAHNLPVLRRVIEWLNFKQMSLLATLEGTHSRLPPVLLTLQDFSFLQLLSRANSLHYPTKKPAVLILASETFAHIIQCYTGEGKGVQECEEKRSRGGCPARDSDSTIP